MASSGPSPTCRSPTRCPRSSWRRTSRSSASSRRRPTSASCSGSGPTTRRSVRALTHVRQLDSAGITGYDRTRPSVSAARAAGDDLDALAQDLAFKARAETQALVEDQRRRVHVLAQPLHRRQRGERRARARARPPPLVVADRPDPADGGAARGDRRRRLHRATRRPEPRRARLARREREPDERRAAAPLRRAGDREPAQERVPREHVARAADAAERDHRLLAGAAAAALRRDQREAGGVPRRHPLVGQPPALADQRRARPVEGRGRAGRARGRGLLAARGARARRRDGARSGRSRTASSSRSSSRRTSTSSAATSGVSARSSSTSSRTPSSSRPRAAASPSRLRGSTARCRCR